MEKKYCRKCIHYSLLHTGSGNEERCMCPALSETIHSPVDGPYKSYKDCYELNVNCDCGYFEKGFSKDNRSRYLYVALSTVIAVAIALIVLIIF